MDAEGASRLPRLWFSVKHAMDKKKRGLWLILPALVLLGAFLWFGFFAPVGKAFQLYDRQRKTVVFSAPIHAGDKLRLEIEHSFEHIPWFEYYTVREDDSFNLDAIAVAGYGAGIPAEMDVPTHIEDGLVWMEEINSVFPKFSWITSSTYMKGLQINGVEVFDFRSLPDASRIRGEIITVRGYLTGVRH